MINDALKHGHDLLENLALDMAPEVSGRLHGIAQGLEQFPKNLDTLLNSFTPEARAALAQNIFNSSLLFSMLAGDIQIEKGFADSMGLDVVRRTNMEGDCRKIAEEFREAAKKVEGR